MTKPAIDVEAFLYEAKLQFINVIEYGISLETILAESASIPPAGARFDIAFEGSLDGPRMSGKVTGVDYLYMRADGRADLHIHGCVAMPDGANVSFADDGVGTTDEGTGLLEIRYRVILHTSCPDYVWVNALPVLGIGTADLSTGAIRVKGYAL